MKTTNDWGANEFSNEGFSEWDPTLDRREFLKLSSAAIALAGLSACVKPPIEKMFSYVSQPEDMIPGEPTFFASHYVLGGIANGILVETHEGRPTRIDGNPGHPANFGAASAIHQALSLSLYDPDRIQNAFHENRPVSITELQTSLAQQFSELQKTGGAGLAILSAVSSSDTQQEQKENLIRKFPKMIWVDYEPLVNGNRESAAKQAFGETLTPIYDFKSARIVVAIESDFLSHPHSPLVYAKDFADNKNLKLFVIESTASLTGAKSKNRLSLKPARVTEFVRALGQGLLNETREMPDASLDANDFLKSLIHSVKNADGPVLFVAGDQQSVEMHSLCHVLNSHFAKNAVRYRKTKDQDAHFGLKGISELTKQMNAGKMNTLLIFGGNPAHTVPGSLDFKSALQKVPYSLHLSNDENETSHLAKWILPETHPLESWSDARAFDGTLSFAQPMISPMYNGLSVSELLHFILTGEKKTGREILALHYQKKWGLNFESKLKESLRQGFVSGSADAVPAPRVRLSFQDLKFPSTLPPDADTLEFSFREDRKVYDGRFANHPWLQELPDPLTRIAWGNAILFHPEEMKARNLNSGDVIEVSNSNRKISGPVFPDPLQARGSAAFHFGYGRTHIGSAGTDIGFDIYPLWEGQANASFKIKSTGKNEELACTQDHHSMEGRDLVRKIAGLEKASHSDSTSLYDKNPITDGDYSWAMTIDLDRCTGCGACVVACQSENNIPVVGKKAVKMGREMQWIRVDRYFEENSTGGNTITHFQPVPCMHCEKAPCEPVCPTGATLHGNGGLNQMVYNRCVGTRYCSNNCPYKVRRFNFLTYIDKTSKLDARARNPNVSVRTRGVMEKCTYCVQRISSARIESARSKKPIADGGVKTACQTTCPSNAIEFGNIKDPNSRVSMLRQSNRNYGLLEELGTRPRTTYLAKVITKEDA